MMEMKRCNTCGDLLENNKDFFYRYSYNYKGTTVFRLKSICKSCNNKKVTRWKEENKESAKIIRQRYYRKNRDLIVEAVSNRTKLNPGKRRGYIINRKYGVDESFIVDLMNNQKGCCAICGLSLIFPDSEKEYSIDHCHNTEKVRGLLCSNCNHLLGNAKDNEDVLLNAIEYLRKSNNINGEII